MRNPLSLIRIKKIDRLLFMEFIPPFLMAFVIAMFVLVMQFLWLYIDDIAGKGIGIFVLVEMIYYMGLSLIPMALPIAMLLASVMVYGNLAEKYELPSMKTAGIPLMRVMRSSMLFAAVIAFSSFVCSNYVIPYANLKFKSRLYDIKKQKPALNLESGVFNDDFQGYSIRIGNKGEDNRTIEDIMMDDDNRNQRNQFNIIRAKKGEMYVTDDNRFFVMNLRDGHQYQKAEPSSIKTDFPFIRTSFKEWTKSFDLSEFDLRRTDENLFKTYHAMLSTRQLSEAIDSIDISMAADKIGFRQDQERKSNYIYYDENAVVMDDTLRAETLLELDSNTMAHDTLSLPPVELPPNASRPGVMAIHKAPAQPKVRSYKIDQPFLGGLDTMESVIFTFDLDKRVTYLESLRTLTRSAKNSLYELTHKQDQLVERRMKYEYQLHSKYGFAVVCFIFLFIGAPMGAIVRKGGLGYPLLVAISFFMVFVILTKVFEKLMKGSDFNPALAAWLPCVILFPVGLFLTIKAMNDSKIINVDPVVEFFHNLMTKLKHLRSARPV